jgi:uncharacterized protein YbaP (TraB family)
VIARFLLLVLAAALTACNGPAEDWPPPSPALWEVTGPDGQQGWLFGTIHALPDGVEWRTPALGAAIESADVLVVEVANLGEGDAGARAFAGVSTSDGLPPLMQRVPAGDRPALSQAMERAGLDEGDLADTETWAAALIIGNRTRTGDSANGVDRRLLATGLRVIGLEGYEEQFALFDGLAEADQIDLLRLVAKATVEDERRTQRAWLTGDMASLEREEMAGLLADPGLSEALIAGRNEAWVERIVGLLSKGRRPLVAVGAGHMIGEGGLPALLATRGFSVRRIQ